MPPRKTPSSPLARRLAALGDDANAKKARLPATVAMREAEALHLEAQAERRRFAELPGFELPDIDELPELVAELRRAEAAWQAARLEPRRVSRTALRKEAMKLRRDLVAAGRYLLRHDERAQHELKMATGRRKRRLALELGDLARFVESHRAQLAIDPTVAAGGGPRARFLMEALLTPRRGDDTGDDALEHRNRVALALEAAMSAVQQAARYLFRGQKEKLRLFQSRYLNSKLRRSRQKRKQPAPANK